MKNTAIIKSKDFIDTIKTHRSILHWHIEWQPVVPLWHIEWQQVVPLLHDGRKEEKILLHQLHKFMPISLYLKTKKQHYWNSPTCSCCSGVLDICWIVYSPYFSSVKRSPIDNLKFQSFQISILTADFKPAENYC